MANPKAFISDPDYIAFLSQDLKERPKDDAGFYIPERLSTHDRLRKRLVEDGGVVQYGDTDSFVISVNPRNHTEEVLITGDLSEWDLDHQMQNRYKDKFIGADKTKDLSEADFSAEEKALWEETSRHLNRYACADMTRNLEIREDDSGDEDVDSDSSSIEFADPNEDFEDEYDDDGEVEVDDEPVEPEKVDATSDSSFAKLFGKAPPVPVENGARSRIFLKKGMDDSAHLNFIKNVHTTLVEKPHTAVRMGVEGFARDPQKRHFSLIPEAKAIFAKSFLLGMGGCLIFHGFVGEATSLFCYGFGKAVKGTDRKAVNVEYEVDKLVLEKALQASSQVFLKTQLQEAMAESKLFTRFSAATKKAEPKVSPKPVPKKEAEVVLPREPKVGKNARRKAEKKSSE